MFSRSPLLRCRSCFGLLVAVGLLVAPPTHAANPAKLFPDFADQKAKLGPVALVADVVVVEDVLGNVEKVYLDDCRHLGQQVVSTFAAAMGEKGYSIQKRGVVASGEVLDPKGSYHILSTWEQHTQDVGGLPVVHPPFFVDSTIAPNEDAQAAWNAVLNAAWAFEKKKGKPAPVLADAAKLHDLIESDYLFTVIVVGTKIPFGKKFGQGMLSGLTHGPVGSAGNVTFSAGIDFTQYSGTGIKVAMIDCRSGEVLWSDSDFE